MPSEAKRVSDAITLLRERHELILRGEFVHACVLQGVDDTETIEIAYKALASSSWRPLDAADRLDTRQLAEALVDELEGE